MDTLLYRSVMGRFTTGVTVLTFLADGNDAGMTANAFMSVSMEPPLILTSIRTASRFNHYVKLGVRYGINFLADEQKLLSSHFGGRMVDGLVLPFVRRDGVPLIEGSLAHLIVRTVDVHPAGDHLLNIAEVEYVKLGEQRKPLVFFSGQYRQVQMQAPLWSPAEASDCW